MFENISQAFQNIWNHKLRSILTMLGIIIGIASIITIVSSIKGTSEQIKENLIGSGTNAVLVQLYQDEYQYDTNDMPTPEGVQVITEQTRQDLEALDGVEAASLFYVREYGASAFYHGTEYTGKVYGVDPYYLSVYGYRLCYGRGFTEEDYQRNRKVLLVDTQAVGSTFSGKNPVGETVEIAGEPFTVVGVVEQTSSFRPVIENLRDYEMYQNNGSGGLFMTTAGWSLAFQFDQPQNVAVKAADTDAMTAAGKAAADLLTERQILSRASSFSYQAQDLLQQAEKMQQVNNSTNRQFIWIASISLLVGGIGVMNIMLVSVTERTGEIGLKKAVGAKRRRIRRQFLTEAAVLTTIGGILGVFFGIGLSILWGRAMETPTAISIPAIVIAVAFSTAIGVIFGLLPASKAAKMNPIDALRRE